MEKALKVALTVAALSLMGMFVNGACERAKPPYNAQVSAQSTAPAQTTPQLGGPLSVQPDPANAVHFTMIYENNLNGETDACG